MKLMNVDRLPVYKDDEYKIDQIKRFERSYPGCIVLRPSYDTEEKLDSDWDKFQQMPFGLRLVSDDQAQLLFGMTNEDMYHEIRKKFLRQNLKQSEMDLNPHIYTPPSLQESVSQDIEEDYDSSDIIKSIRVVDRLMSNKRTIHETKTSTIIKKLNKAIGNSKDPNTYISRSSFYLIDEIPDITISIPYAITQTPINNMEELLLDNNAHKEWYMNQKLTCLGVKPKMKNYYTKWTNAVYQGYKLVQEGVLPNAFLYSIGWNHLLYPSNSTFQLANKRANEVLRESVGYNFINITESVDEGYEEFTHPNERESQRSAYIYIISSLNTLNDSFNTRRVYFSLDGSTLYTFDDGIFVTPKSIDEVLSSTYPTDFIDVYGFSLDISLWVKLKENIQYVCTNQTRFHYNFLQNICRYLNMSTPDIANQKLFCTYLVNMLITLAKSNVKTPSMVYILPILSGLTKHDKPNIYHMSNNTIGEFRARCINRVRLESVINYIPKSNKILMEDSYRDYIELTPITENKEYRLPFSEEEKSIVYRYPSDNHILREFLDIIG